MGELFYGTPEGIRTPDLLVRSLTFRCAFNSFYIKGNKGKQIKHKTKLLNFY